MVAVYLRKFGNTDITMITDFDLRMQVAMSDQPEDVKARAQSCMNHLRNWAKERGNHFAVPIKTEENDRTKKRPKVSDVDHHEDGQRRFSSSTERVGSGTRRTGKDVAQSEASLKPKVLHPKRGEHQQPRRKADVQMTMEEWQADTRYRRGTIERETASDGWKNGKRVFKNCWRAVIQVNGQRYRHRGKTRQECREWLKAVCAKKILPTDNKADWLRMEQRKDEAARIDELIVSAAEEANIVYEYRHTGDTEILYDYCIKALLPHMVYYCAHSLHLGQDRALTCSRQAVGLILTKIVGGRPVTNITFTCKRMLRTYQNRGDFWYYEKAPEAVKLMVNRIDMSALTELYKVTKDRRI
jgi:hypothetical protein